MSERYQRVSDILELSELLRKTLVGLTMDEIAEQFEVSRRTAERMVGALRERYPEVGAETRDGRKYWSLPTSSLTQPRQLPVDLASLSRRTDNPAGRASNFIPFEKIFRDMADEVLGHLSVGIFVLDFDFKVVWISEAMERYFGIDKKSVIGRDKRMLIRETIRNHLEDPLHFEQRVLATYNDNSYIEHFQCHVLAGEGREERWLEYWSQPIQAGPYQGGRVEHYVDVSETVRAEIARRRELKILQGRLREVDLPSEEGGIAGAIANAIKTPVADILAIANNPELQAKEHVGADALRAISGLATRVGDRVEQMLKLTERDLPRYESSNATSILSAAVEAIRAETDRPGIDVQMTVSGSLIHLEFDADPELLGRALRELTKNAVEAMPGGGELSLRANLRSDPPLVCFCVSDTGSGLEEPESKRVFEPFYSTRESAPGLGLAIAQQIAETHGGRIGLLETEREGTTFYLEIPLDRVGSCSA